MDTPIYKKESGIFNCIYNGRFQIKLTIEEKSYLLSQTKALAPSMAASASFNSLNMILTLF